MQTKAQPAGRRYRGVAFVPRSGRWRTTFKHKTHRYCLGTFSTPEEAARVWDLAAIKSRGDSFSALNFDRASYEYEAQLLDMHSFDDTLCMLKMKEINCRRTGRAVKRRLDSALTSTDHAAPPGAERTPSTKLPIPPEHARRTSPVRKGKVSPAPSHVTRAPFTKSNIVVKRSSVSGTTERVNHPRLCAGGRARAGNHSTGAAAAMDDSVVGATSNKAALTHHSSLPHISTAGTLCINAERFTAFKRHPSATAADLSAPLPVPTSPATFCKKTKSSELLPWGSASAHLPTAHASLPNTSAAELLLHAGSSHPGAPASSSLPGAACLTRTGPGESQPEARSLSFCDFLRAGCELASPRPLGPRARTLSERAACASSDAFAGAPAFAHAGSAPVDWQMRADFDSSPVAFGGSCGLSLDGGLNNLGSQTLICAADGTDDPDAREPRMQRPSSLNALCTNAAPLDLGPLTAGKLPSCATTAPWRSSDAVPSASAGALSLSNHTFTPTVSRALFPPDTSDLHCAHEKGPSQNGLSRASAGAQAADHQRRCSDDALTGLLPTPAAVAPLRGDSSGAMSACTRMGGHFGRGSEGIQRHGEHLWSFDDLALPRSNSLVSIDNAPMALDDLSILPPRPSSSLLCPEGVGLRSINEESAWISTDADGADGFRAAGLGLDPIGWDPCGEFGATDALQGLLADAAEFSASAADGVSVGALKTVDPDADPELSPVPKCTDMCDAAAPAAHDSFDDSPRLAFQHGPGKIPSLLRSTASCFGARRDSDAALLPSYGDIFFGNALSARPAPWGEVEPFDLPDLRSGSSPLEGDLALGRGGGLAIDHGRSYAAEWLQMPLVPLQKGAHCHDDLQVQRCSRGFGSRPQRRSLQGAKGLGEGRTLSWAGQPPAEPPYRAEPVPWLGVESSVAASDCRSSEWCGRDGPFSAFAPVCERDTAHSDDLDGILGPSLL